MRAELISIAEAQRRILATAGTLPSERVAVSSALDRVLAQDLVATGDVPSFDSSAMDGYALQAGQAGRTLALVGESRAGHPSGRVLAEGEAIRISTGAVVPAGADAVVRQEDTERLDGTVRIIDSVAQGENIRRAGDDLRSGVTVLSAGRRLGVAELGTAVAAGAGEVVVTMRPRVVVVCTGDELRAPGETLAPGEIHNSNATMLESLVTRARASTVRSERLGDDRKRTELALEAALGEADLVLVSGGVSVGPHDHVKAALEELGVRESFWGVALRPGKPTWFGSRAGTLVFGLPGNPVSSVVTFALFVAPALDALEGAQRSDPGSRAVLAAPVARDKRREQALRVRLEHDDGRLLATPIGREGSHLVSALIGADALALIAPGDGYLEAGELVALWPLPI